MKSSDQAYREFAQRRAAGSAATSISYSETLDNEMMAQQMNGQLLSVPTQYFYHQQSNPSEVKMQRPMRGTPEQRSSASLGRHGSRSLSKTKRSKSACPSAVSLKSRGNRSRNTWTRSQTRLSRNGGHSATKS